MTRRNQKMFWKYRKILKAEIIQPDIDQILPPLCYKMSRYCESYPHILKTLSVSSMLGVYCLLQDILNRRPKCLKDKQMERVCESKQWVKKDQKTDRQTSFLTKKKFKFNKILGDDILSASSLQRNCFISSGVYTGCMKESLHYHCGAGSCSILNIIKYSICKLK